MFMNLPESFDSKIQSDNSKSRLFFTEVIKSYKKAATSVGKEIRRLYKIGGSYTELIFAGPKGVPLLTPAFEHLISDKKEKAELKIYIWDSASTGVTLPSVPWNVNDCISRNQPWRFRNKRYEILFQPENNILNLMDSELHKACFWINDFQNLPEYEIGSPLLAVLHWWFSRRHLQLIHAAAVGRIDGGVLIVGKGGSGKSSTALSCLQSDLLYTGDDYCLISNKSRPIVYSLYSTGKLNDKDVSLFPYLKPSLYKSDRPGNQNKAIYFIHRCFPEKTLKRFPLKAVLIPKLTGHSSPRIEKIPPASGLLALGPSTVFQLPGFEEQTFRNLSEVVKKVPCYKLELAKGRDKNASVLSRFLSRL
jgi:hypothetical protein